MLHTSTMYLIVFFFFNDTATTEIYTLSLHDALPILVRQLITESILMALAGGALGLALASAGMGSLLAMAPSTLPRVGDIRLDARIFAFTFAVSLLTGVLFGLAPAIYATRTNLRSEEHTSELQSRLHLVCR